MHKNDYPCPCGRCGKEFEPHDWYMLHDVIWNALVDNTGESLLCMPCAEIRFGGKFKLKHFTDAPINHGSLGFDCKEYCKSK